MPVSDKWLQKVIAEQPSGKVRHALKRIQKRVRKSKAIRRG